MMVALIFVACQPRAKRRQSDRPLVVVSIPPYMEIVKAIASDTVDVESAIPVGYNMHTSEVTPKQTEMIQEASLWIGIGESYEKKLLTALSEAKTPVAIVQMNEKVPLLPLKEDTNFVDVCGEGHSSLHESKDLHFWLSPKRLPQQATIITEALIKLQPDQAEEYQNNLKTFLRKVSKLDQRVIDLLSPFRQAAIVTSHAAFGYFCNDYSLTQIALECEGKSPLPKTIQGALMLAKNSNTQCVFTFPGHNNKGALLIAERLSLKTYEVDPLSEALLGTIEQIAIDIAEKP